MMLGYHCSRNIFNTNFSKGWSNIYEDITWLLGWVKAGYGWTATHFVDRHRRSENATGSNLVVIDFDGDTTNDNFESALDTAGGAQADKKRQVNFKSAFWETTLPQSFAAAMKAKHSKGFVSSTEQGFPSSYSGTNVYTPIKTVGYVYRIKFYGNPGKLKEPEIEIYLI